MTFTVHAKSHSGIQTAWTTKANQFAQEVPVAIPPEFAGPGTGLSPEDLYAMALENCFIATFKVFAEKSKLQFQWIDVRADLVVDRNSEGRPFMAKIHLFVKLSGVSQKENAQRILERTSENCMILNSVLTEKTFNFELTD